MLSPLMTLMSWRFQMDIVQRTLDSDGEAWQSGKRFPSPMPTEMSVRLSLKHLRNCAHLVSLWAGGRILNAHAMPSALRLTRCASARYLQELACAARAGLTAA